MAKNKNKKKRNEAVSMDTSEHTVSDLPQTMDTSESGTSKPVSNSLNRKSMKKGRPMKKSKNVRKMKAIAKAISKNEKSAEKLLKHESKAMRTQSAKMLYD
ncbi:hypothetical protein CFOL_v3_28795 [Cephalotus follicularis]|uniref:Uncharacterized protein n=1 Tax=Cephalotus follicularis TaxID=3775 RepID=A0A1Q3CYP2_CEPFO|nr:hypothetical protein CFOL_v3_28795 [Cephalotus follicularis]